MFKVLFFSLLILICRGGFAEEAKPSLVLRCSAPIPSVFAQDFYIGTDQEFQQGSGVYIDLYLNEFSGKASLVSRTAEGPDIILFEEADFLSLHAEIPNSIISVSWKVNGEISYVSVVYPGVWVMALEISDNTEIKDKSLISRTGAELPCKEAPGFSLLL